MRAAAEMRNTLSRFDNPNRERSGGSFPAFDIWFKEQVQDKAPWDYKYLTPDHKVYEPFGNFNYGATGAAAGYSLDTLYRVAGWIQQHGGDASAGSGTTSPTLLDAYLGRSGSYPYGDASLDAGYIQQGYSYAKCKEAQGRR